MQLYILLAGIFLLAENLNILDFEPYEAFVHKTGLIGLIGKFHFQEGLPSISPLKRYVLLSL